jgi:lipopolysaccharide transport system ATP-binding protein
MKRQMHGRVEFRHVWKKFRYGEVHNRLRDLIPAVGRRLIARGRGGNEVASGEFWALQDVDFTVTPGEALGIIGANGAGKSTVLKLLTRVMRPTRGYCHVTGRVGSLIEVAAGFHGDLTGRENIFLQGAVLGMSRPEIAGKFEQIVEFSGIAPFIDTPVKRYSSGMNARLGFSVAAHLDPEVLVIDEVLSVGDAAFQKKAFDRIMEMVRREIPVVVVSHQLDQISALCTHAILLDRGRVVADGTPGECIAQYVSGQFGSADLKETDAAIRIEALRCEAGSPIPSGERLTFSLACVVRDVRHTGRDTVGLRVRSVRDGSVLFSTHAVGCDLPLPPDGWYWIEVCLQLNVPAGSYIIESYVLNHAQGWEVAPGPRVKVEVAPSAHFSGIVQMNPEMRIPFAGPFDSAGAPTADPAMPAAAGSGAATTAREPE